MMLCAMLNACATPATPPIADSACLTFRPISYAVPPRDETGERAWTADDARNEWDSRETVEQVQDFNVRYLATCPSKAAQ